MRSPFMLVAALGALLVLAAPAAAANEDPVRIWSVSKVVQGAGVVPVRDGAQAGSKLQQSVDLGRVVFNLPLHAPYWYFLPRDRAFGSLFSSADGRQYSVLAQAPPPNPLRAGAAKGAITHLDEYQAYEKRASDASLRITLSDVLLQTIDDNNRLAAWECPAEGTCEPVRTVVRFHARAYAASAGGDFFAAGGTAYLEGHQHSWRPGAATSADSPGPLWGQGDFDVDGDADDSDTGAAGVMGLNRAVHVRVPLAAVRTGELFAVHVSLEAEAVDDRGGESAAQAFIQDPQKRVPLLSAHGLKARGQPRFKEPAPKPLAPARCPAGRPRGAGALGFSAAGFGTNESERAPLVLVTRTGGSRGAASATLTTSSGTAQSGRDFKRTTTTVRFGNHDTAPRLVEIPLREDVAVEPAETFTVQLGHARCGGLGSRRQATVTIVDDDEGPPAPPAQPAPVPTAAPVIESPAPSGLDPTFGGDGRVSTPVGGLGNGEAVVIQPSGTIATAGWSSSPATGRDFTLTRHDAAGNLLGITTTDLGGPFDEAYDAALTPDGGIVAVGRTDAAGFTNGDFGVVRYGPGGTPDDEFGTHGIVRTDFTSGGDRANAVAVQPDGKIVVAGSTFHVNDGDVALVRYDAHGMPDDGFGTDGVVTLDLGTHSDDARALAIQPDGAIVVAGVAGEDIALARFTPAGKPDDTFGAGGKTITHLGSEAVANGVALTPDGHIAVAGYTLGPRVNRDFLLARYTSAGELDTAWGDHGTVKTDVLGGDDFAENLVVDSAGRLVLVGRASSPTILDLALVRYTPAGTPDASFDGDGILTADFHGRGEFGQDVALDAQGRIVAAGYTANGPDTEFALLRAIP